MMLMMLLLLLTTTRKATMTPRMLMFWLYVWVTIMPLCGRHHDQYPDHHQASTAAHLKQQRQRSNLLIQQKQHLRLRIECRRRLC
jgi:hypothetical protein